MKYTIHKYELEEKTTLYLPPGIKVLSVGFQGVGKPLIWIAVPKVISKKIPFMFKCVLTGETINSTDLDNHIGSAVRPQDNFVVHVFQCENFADPLDDLPSAPYGTIAQGLNDTLSGDSFTVKAKDVPLMDVIVEGKPNRRPIAYIQTSGRKVPETMDNEEILWTIADSIPHIIKVK